MMVLFAVFILNGPDILELIIELDPSLYPAGQVSRISPPAGQVLTDSRLRKQACWVSYTQ